MPPPLAELQLRTSYYRGLHDIADEFYLPCMRRSAGYDRAVGYFRSTVFAVAWPALRQFVASGGRIRLVCSCVLSPPDIAALDKGYVGRNDADLELFYAAEVRRLLADPVIRGPARVLAALVAQRVVELKVAVLPPISPARESIFHAKIGVFHDAYGNAVAFKGSMNETWEGLSSYGNHEEISVAATWLGERDEERARDVMQYFEQIWANKYPGFSVFDFPTLAREELERGASDDWERELATFMQVQPPELHADSKGRQLRRHQELGLDAWRANNRRGIWEFATGSGKTFTALAAIREALTTHREIPIVVVPDRVLFQQWYRELVANTRDIRAHILRAGAGNSEWRGALRDWTTRGGDPRLVLATLPTASSSDFLTRVAAGSSTMLVVDEVHRAGAPKNRRLLDSSRFMGARLGMSATPERVGDADGTSAIMAFFERVLEPRYSLRDAIRDGVLCPYFYRSHPVPLEHDEKERWDALTSQIRRASARSQAGGTSPEVADRIRLLLIRRARIIKKARGKVQLAVAVLRERHKEGDRWLIYCDDLEQLHDVSRAIDEAGFQSIPFHSQMKGDREGTLRWLATHGGIVVAIKCLDEGVDVPNVSHALILASSRNPREFIQRRGRVLRKAEGKTLAYVHDAIVVPPSRQAAADPFAAGELARAIQFAEYADNPGCSADLKRIAIDLGIDLDGSQRSGVEDEEEEDEDEAAK